MKKVLFAVLVFCVFLNTVYGQEAIILDEALRAATGYLKERIPTGSKVVVLNFQSDYRELSNYVIDEMIANLVNIGNLAVVDRQNLSTIQEEINFQMSGEVSDESAQTIGQKLGAQTIVSGAITPLGDLYRFRVRAIEVETAAIQGVWNQNIKTDGVLAALTKDKSYQGPSISKTGDAGTADDFSLDGKTRFGFSLNGVLGTGWGVGGMVTVYEKFFPDFFAAPSVFVTAKYFAIDDRKRLTAIGVGLLLKRRLTKNERLLLNLGISLEYLFGYAEEDPADYWDLNRGVVYSADIGVFGMGVQGGLSYRLTPNISLDINGLVKFGFSSAELHPSGYVCSPENHLYDPGVGGVEIGVSFMF
jgi:TolB-like protein